MRCNGTNRYEEEHHCAACGCVGWRALFDHLYHNSGEMVVGRPHHALLLVAS